MLPSLILSQNFNIFKRCVLKYVNSFRIANPSYLNFSYFWKRSQCQIRLWIFRSLKHTTMNGIAGYFPILVLNLNLYGIACTAPSPRCKGLLFAEGICQTIQHNNFETLQIRHNYFQGVDRELHRFLKCIQTKKIVEICSFGLVWEYFSWNLNKTEVAQYFKSIMLWN